MLLSEQIGKLVSEHSAAVVGETYSAGTVNESGGIDTSIFIPATGLRWAMIRIANSLADTGREVVVAKRVTPRYLQSDSAIRHIRETIRIVEQLAERDIKVRDVLFYSDVNNFVSMAERNYVFDMRTDQTLLRHLMQENIPHRLFGSVMFSDVPRIIREFIRSDIRWANCETALSKGKYRALTRIAVNYMSTSFHNLTHAEVTLIRNERGNANRKNNKGKNDDYED